MPAKTIKRQAENAVIVLTTRVQNANKTGAELRLIIKTIRAMLLERQQAHADSKVTGR